MLASKPGLGLKANQDLLSALGLGLEVCGLALALHNMVLITSLLNNWMKKT